MMACSRETAPDASPRTNYSEFDIAEDGSNEESWLSRIRDFFRDENSFNRFLMMCRAYLPSNMGRSKKLFFKVSVQRPANIEDPPSQNIFVAIYSKGMKEQLVNGFETMIPAQLVDTKNASSLNVELVIKDMICSPLKHEIHLESGEISVSRSFLVRKPEMKVFNPEGTVPLTCRVFSPESSIFNWEHQFHWASKSAVTSSINIYASGAGAVGLQNNVDSPKFVTTECL